MADTPREEDSKQTEGESERELAEALRVGKFKPKAGDPDMRDAETFRALREQEDEK